MALVMIPASAVTNLTGEYSYTTSTDPLAISAVNSNTASGSGGLQANSYGAGGKGVFGYSDASGAPGFGLAGISQNGYGVYGSSFGAGITAIYGENLSSGAGIGIEGSSANGTGTYGVGGQNGVEGQTNASAGEYAGVLGIDHSDSGSGGNGYGVEGTSVGGDSAVGGQASGSGDGLYGYSNSGYGLDAYSDSGNAIDADTPGIGGTAVLGVATGEGAEFFGYSGTSTHPALKVEPESTGTDVIGTYNSGGETFIVQAGTANASGSTYSNGTDVQLSGDLYVAGQVYTACRGHFPGIAGDCGDDPLSTVRSSTGVNLRTYSAKQSTRTVEDVGEAQIVNGQGHVALDPTFASSISRTSPYLVFITPEGDSRGLYVTARTLSGFTVVESSGGRSTVGFSYRIVAHPYGDTGTRMAAIVPRGSNIATNYNVPASNEGLKLKQLGVSRRKPASIGARVTRPPHVWVQNLHRQ
jgi:hypothetical protein